MADTNLDDCKNGTTSEYCTNMHRNSIQIVHLLFLFMELKNKSLEQTDIISVILSTVGTISHGNDLNFFFNI